MFTWDFFRLKLIDSSPPIKNPIPDSCSRLELWRYLTGTMADYRHLLFPSWLVGFNLGSINPLTIGITAEN